MRLRRLSSPLLILLLLLSAALQAAPEIHKSANDPRDYLSFTLPNQLQVMVISDPTTDKAAASLDVGVGSDSDPKDRQGLAHFLEHMLFLGTKKYPDASAYQTFIHAHGGSHNAYTSYRNTNFFFDVSADSLAPALDRFAQFFISPLFNETYVDRERHAVNSEYRMGLRDDGRRLWSVSKQLVNPAHSFSQFNVGNLQTLSNKTPGKLRKDLMDFYHRYYSANLMTLVVLGREPVTDLRKMVEARFAAVKNFNARPYRNKATLYRQDSLPVRLDVQTLDDIHDLSLTFPLPPAEKYWAHKPLYYIDSQIGYEGRGSLLAALKARGWANGLDAATGPDLPDASSLVVDIDLTDQGFKHYQEVVALFFSYIRLLREEGIDEHLYNEERQLDKTRFRFIEPTEPSRYVRQLARAMHLYPASHAIDAPYYFAPFDAGLIRRFLEPVRPDNMILTRAARDLDTDKQDPWYHAGYRITHLTDATLAQWRRNPAGNDVLAIRSPNPFIAQDLALKPKPAQPADRPQQILTAPGLDLWYQQDMDFRVPRADFFFALFSPQANDTATDAVLTELYTRMVNDQLNETLYDAGLAGLSANLYAHMKGFSVRLSGYNDREPVLLQALLNALAKPALDPKRFALIRQEYDQDLANERNDKPFHQTTGELYNLLLPQWSSEQKRAALAKVDLAQLQAFVPRLFARTRLRVLAHGNLSADEATAMAHSVNRTLRQGAEVAAPIEIPVVQLDDGELVQTLHIDHNDSAVTLYTQGGDTGLKTRAAYLVLGEMLGSPFYDQLRTEQQLGYIVTASPMPVKKVPGMAFIVQSPTVDPVTLEQHIDRFLSGMQPMLDKLDAQALANYKRSALARVLQKETSLGERSARYWQELDLGDTRFDSRERLASAIRDLTVADLQQQFSHLTDRELLVRSFGNGVRGKFDKQETGRRADARISALKAAESFVPGA